MATEEKSYKSSTGVDEFWYGEVGDGKLASYIEHVKYLQTINVEMPQDITRAYGDNKTAEMAVSSGDITVTSGFHRIPVEDKQRILGLEVVDGITGMGSTDNPPYLGVIFAKTFENGMREYVGLPKGLFTRPKIEGKTKEDGTEFSSEEIEGQFMDREVDGFTEEKSVLFAVDKKGSTTNRDKLFMLVFGMPYPGTTTEPAGA
ncbi:phage tail protein [Priestia megaterium]|uniref:major tail protein n=1 Tax=Priestia megaterium TaxID=1404 RepID=UPI00234E8E8C|nr:major tail protein [Priestia megaterium]MDC7770336.1 phage tail protein [Priestia megaterium]